MTLETELTADTINLFDDELFEQGLAQEAFRILRRDDPIHWTPPTDDVVGVWNFVKYKDVLQVSRHPELFGSEEGIVQFRPIRDEDMQAAATGNGKMLITMDPPRHVKLRRLVNKGFTPRAVRGMHDQIVAIAKELLDGIAKKGESDFVIDVASQLPLAVICGMLGIERKDWDLMFQLTNKVLGPGDPEYQTDVPIEQRGTPEAANTTGMMGTFQMFGFFGQILQAARTGERPLGDDLISILVTSEIDGEKLTDDDILWFCFLLILAGNETTRNAISGGLWTLCDHPDQMAQLQADMSLLPSAVEEILRWVSPVTHMARVALADTEVGGQPIKKGERVVMWYPSVNRDEDVFPDSFTFDITRSPNDHLAFGIGEHFCLGSGFARLEITTILEQVLTRFPDIQLNGKPERLRSSFIGGIKHLPVKFTPEP